MTKNIEIEFKNIVSKSDFDLISQYFSIKKDQFFTQVNHYFDTLDFSLKQARSALRIRELSHNYEFTLKKPAKPGLLEINQILSKQEACLLRSQGKIPNGEVKNELTKMGINIEEIKYFGSLTTYRAEINYKDGLLVFDHSLYLDKEDFEIEYEVNDWSEGKIIFEHLMNELNIPISSSDNKVARFYSAKKDQHHKSY